MNEHPPSMIPGFDAKYGIRTVLKLVASENETVRLQTLKLLGFFLQKSTLKYIFKILSLSMSLQKKNFFLGENLRTWGHITCIL